MAYCSIKALYLVRYSSRYSSGTSISTVSTVPYEMHVVFSPDRAPTAPSVPLTELLLRTPGSGGKARLATE